MTRTMKAAPLWTHRTQGKLYNLDYVLGKAVHVGQRLLNGTYARIHSENVLALRPREVLIHINDEAGEVYATLIHEKHPELWLESFATSEEACRFCLQNNIAVTDVVNDVEGE